jgi:hypothetical protein
MFVGRRLELQDISTPGGTAIVYGGRQLGKTALLKRAKSLENRPENRRYAVYFSAQDIYGEAFERRFVQELTHVGIIVESTEFPAACREIRQRIERKEIEYLLILVDEADALLRAEQNAGYAVINEIIDLRADKPNGFKCVFAGLHNVMRTSKATENNSPMTKLGNPLCIKPFSYADARRLVRYPMSYLGIAIGDSQLMTILTESNNYPGNLHLICSELVKEVSDKFIEKYRSSDPPFEVDDSVLGGVVKNGSIRSRIREKLMLTLKLDPHYYALACAIAYMGYESEESVQAFSAADIEKTFAESGRELDAEQICALLDEMCDMGILTASQKNAETCYRFRKNSFRRLIGTSSDALKGLLEDE